MSSTLERFRQFKPAGPVAAAFLSDTTSFVRTIRGPVGGGKSVTCVFDALMNASRAPVCRDGVIRFRLAIIGLTYGQIERNLFPTWKAWLPEDGGEWTEGEFVGGSGRFATHKLQWDVLRGDKLVPVQFEAIFAAIGENAVEQFMRGFEPTAFWLYEMDQLPADLLDQAIFRLGRYPKKSDLPDGVEQRSYVVGDLNAPDVDSWYYTLFEENLPPGFKQYVQPAGDSPEAENLQNLPKGYYDRQKATLAKKPNLLKRFVKNQYAPSGAGQPVYPEYADERHLAPGELEVLKGVPIRIGVDAGLRAPAAVMAQLSSHGQWRILAEVVPGRVGTKSFATLIRQTLGEIAPGATIELGYADPAGFTGGETEDAQLAWAETLMHELGVPIEPAPSNELDLRLDAVRDELNANIDGNTPALIISRRCKVLRKGFASHYRYMKRKQAENSTLGPKPEKNDWSHVQDALQYLMLGTKGRYGTIAGTKGHERGRPRAVTSSSTVMKSSWRPFA